MKTAAEMIERYKLDAMKNLNPYNSDICDVCRKPIEPGETLYGCEQCGRLFCLRCNSVDDNRCVSCSK